MSDGEHLRLLLIEDNPGDARLITEMLRDADELSQRVTSSDAPPGSPDVHHESRLSAGLDWLESEPIDVILLDLGLPDSTGIETLTAVSEATEQTPIVVLTGLDDREVGVEAIQRGAQEYLIKDEVTSALLVRSIHHAIERKQQEVARLRHQEHLQTLNRLHTLVRDVSHAAIQTATREKLERRVCERLVESEAFRFAWIGEVQRGGQEVIPRTAAGNDAGYLDEINVTIDEEGSEGPTASAIRTGRMVVTDDIRTDYERWRDHAEEGGFRSSAAIPLVHDEMLYGVLNVYSPEPGTFSGPGTEMFEQLGEIVGHAFSAIDRKEALISDTVHELDFRIGGVADPLVALTADGEASIDVERVIRTNDETLLLYGSIDGMEPEAFREVVTEIEWVENVRLIGPSYDRTFEVTVARAIPFIETLAAYGGKFESLTVADGEMRVIAELPRSSDTRRLLENIQSVCAGAELLAQRATSRGSDPDSAHQAVFDERLTEKQRTALESAYFAGFFDSPRASSGEEVAESLDVSSATFFQHLRKAQQKLLTAIFEN